MTASVHDLHDVDTAILFREEREASMHLRTDVIIIQSQRHAWKHNKELTPSRVHFAEPALPTPDPQCFA